MIKATLPDEFGRIWGPPNFALPSQYLVRLALANVVFGDECKLEAVVRRPGGLVVVMSHPERHGTAAVEAEVHDFMVKNHFVFYPHRFGPCWYRRVDNVLIFDAEPGNFVKTSLGLYPIDVILQNPDDAMLRLLLE